MLARLAANQGLGSVASTAAHSGLIKTFSFSRDAVSNAALAAFVAAASSRSLASPSAYRSSTSTALRLRGSLISRQIRMQQATTKSRHFLGCLISGARQRSNMSCESLLDIHSASVIFRQ